MRSHTAPGGPIAGRRAIDSQLPNKPMRIFSHGSGDLIPVVGIGDQP